MFVNMYVKIISVRYQNKPVDEFYCTKNGAKLCWPPTA